MQFFVFLTLALAALTNGVPLENRDVGSVINAIECKIVDYVVKSLHAIPSATPFCSSFLQIPTLSFKATSTIPTYTSTTVITTTGTNTITAPIVTSSVSTVSTTTICIPVNKRNAEPAVVPVKVPTVVLPSQLQAFGSALVSTACRCLMIPTPSVTSTTITTLTSIITNTNQVAATTTVTPTTSITSTSYSTVNYCAPTVTCGNAGIQVAEYANAPNNDHSGYPEFVPQNYKTQTPSATTSITYIGGFSGGNPFGGNINVYGLTFRGDFFALNHRGYIYAVQGGTYTFTLNPRIDDIAELWVGSLAYAGWTRSNEMIEEVVTTFNPVTYTTTLAQGTYTPFRVMYANAQSGYQFTMSITAPDGTVILGSNTGQNAYIVQFSCDGIQAPKYPPFGAEI